ncbi:TPA: DNA cytosine methyltransferase, partial [Pseudomonas aeruginosa]
MNDALKFYEFFAGGGMARAGLGGDWDCLFANDLDRIKASTYIENWGDAHFDNRDVRDVKTSDLKGIGDLAWASFPCQDLSVAGNGLGIGSSGGNEITRSGALWPFLDLIEQLRLENRQPPLLVLENVVGLLTLEGGRDFSAICERLREMGYCYGATIVDAKHFLPQSRPRVFIIAILKGINIPTKLFRGMASSHWHSPTLLRTYRALPSRLHEDWVWWDLGDPPALREDALHSFIQRKNVIWNTQEETDRLIGMMAPSHLARLDKAKLSGRLAIGSLYLRMRREGGVNRQRAEITFSPLLGCLRTPRGGASRPRIITIEGGSVKTRLLTSNEASKLMGLEDSFLLPSIYHHAFKVIGDGVAVPVVRFLAERLLEPLAWAARLQNNLQGQTVV